MAEQELSTKWCWGCQTILSIENFGKHKSRKDGLNALCRPCANASSRRVRHSNPERARKWSRDHYARNPEARKHSAKCWAGRNKDKVSAIAVKWRHLHQDKARQDGVSAALAREKYARNPAPARKASKKWRNSNLERVRSYVRNRRALRVSAPGAHDGADIEAIMAAQKGKCAYCRCVLRERSRHVDHIKPLSKGGSNDPKNLQMTCSACNQRKSNKDPIDFARQLGRLL